MEERQPISHNRGAIITAGASDVFTLLGTRPEGLTPAEVTRRLTQYGQNIISRRPSYPLWRLLIDQVKDPLIYVLLAAAAVTTLLQHYSDTTVILAVVFLDGIIGFIQEYRATRAMEALQKMAVPTARVRREGIIQTISSVELVPGDIVGIEAGTRVPADLRLVRSNQVFADESLLTGEAEPVEKTSNPLADPHTPMADCLNLAYAGSLIVEGRGEGVVIATGPRSELGKIAQTVEQVEKAQTPLQRRLHRFSRVLALGILSLAVVVMLLGLLQGMPPIEIFLASVALAVSVIPEGLPVVVTVVLSLGARRMAQRKALVRKLPAAETMGSTQVICTDKTGTLTLNHMRVRSLAAGPWCGEARPEDALTACRLNLNTLGASANDETTTTILQELLRVAVFCNNAEYSTTEKGEPVYSGNPTEVALLEAAVSFTPAIMHQRSLIAPTSEVPFSSARKFMAVVQKDNTNTYTLYAKGAPEVILSRCEYEWSPEELRPLDRSRWFELAAEMGRQGQRVVALARRHWEMPSVTEEQVQALVLVGLVGILDPPRPEVFEAVRGCQEAGIRVVMVTGDHPSTAAAIAGQVGILEQIENSPARDTRIVTGQELAQMSEEELAKRLPEISVYARVTPHDKLRIVDQFQRSGQVVAVTGDGVNDAPALRKAEIGIAMGKAGTEAAREVADVVLLDDSFASIYEAVKEGRYIFENIRKVTLFLIGCGAAEVFAILGVLAAGWPLPYTAVQILWINLVTNGLQDVALAFEPGEPFVLHRKPRGVMVPVIDRLLLQHMAAIAPVFSLGTLAVFHHQLALNGNLAEARTAAITTMVMFQFWQAFNSRSLVQSVFKVPLLSNPFLFGSTLLAVIAQILFIYSSPMQRLFGTIPLAFNQWALIVSISLTGILAMEISKLIARKKEFGLL